MGPCDHLGRLNVWLQSELKRVSYVITCGGQVEMSAPAQS